MVVGGLQLLILLQQRRQWPRHFIIIAGFLAVKFPPLIRIIQSRSEYPHRPRRDSLPRLGDSYPLTRNTASIETNKSGGCATTCHRTGVELHRVCCCGGNGDLACAAESSECDLG
jgi:hypothetical protein